MPGKVNPVIPEVVTQVAAQVIGNDAAITVGGLQGHFELNVFIPMMARNLLDSIRLLASASRLLAEKCVDGIEANREQCERYAELTLSAATALNPHIGYDKASEIVKEASPRADHFATSRGTRAWTRRSSTRLSTTARWRSPTVEGFRRFSLDERGPGRLVVRCGPGEPGLRGQSRGDHMRRLMPYSSDRGRDRDRSSCPPSAITDGELDGNGHPSVGLMVAQTASGTPLWRCSGTLISATIFLTAGHCTEPPAAHVEIWFDDGRRVRDPGNGYPFDGDVGGTPYTHPRLRPERVLHPRRRRRRPADGAGRSGATYGDASRRGLSSTR